MSGAPDGPGPARLRSGTPGGPRPARLQGGAADGLARLREWQGVLVAALVAAGEIPPGFDVRKVEATREALLRKRSGEVAAAWPALAAALGPQWTVTFREFAAGRPPAGSLRDGWDLARYLAAEGRLPAAGRAELRTRERLWRYDGQRAPRRRLAGRVARLIRGD